MDKNKVYYPKNNDFQINNYSYDGPSFSFNGRYIIEIKTNALKDKKLYTNENEKRLIDIFDGDENALSEDGNFNGIYAKEYEVFQIIFE